MKEKNIKKFKLIIPIFVDGKKIKTTKVRVSKQR
jgi:hypothetical protein